MTMKLYVGNLAFQTTNQELKELFARSGTIESASVVEVRKTGRSRGFGFVEMASQEERDTAMRVADQILGTNFGSTDSLKCLNRSLSVTSSYGK